MKFLLKMLVVAMLAIAVLGVVSLNLNAAEAKGEQVTDYLQSVVVLSTSDRDFIYHLFSADETFVSGSFVMTGHNGKKRIKPLSKDIQVPHLIHARNIFLSRRLNIRTEEEQLQLLLDLGYPTRKELADSYNESLQ